MIWGRGEFFSLTERWTDGGRVWRTEKGRRGEEGVGMGEGLQLVETMWERYRRISCLSTHTHYI